MTLATQVERAINRAGVEVIGVSIGSVADHSTWRVDHVPGASQADHAAAAAAIAAFDPTDRDVLADAESGDAEATSRQKDILAMIAWTIRLKDLAAWNAMSLPQKKQAVFAEADNWRDIRVFIDKNL